MPETVRRVSAIVSHKITDYTGDDYIGSFQDLTGQRFGKLVVIKRGEDYVSPKGYKSTNWVCQCDCGNTVIVRRCNLYTGASMSCGCLRKDYPNRKRHGLSHTRIHNIWSGIKDRCYNPNSESYKYYGARGIVMCDEWKEDFEAFANWAFANGYDEDLSIDRIDYNGNYCPDNCRWASARQQANNRRGIHMIEYDGKTMNVSGWAAEVGISYNKLKDRINKCGWDIARALATP